MNIQTEKEAIAEQIRNTTKRIAIAKKEYASTNTMSYLEIKLAVFKDAYEEMTVRKGKLRDNNELKACLNKGN